MAKTTPNAADPAPGGEGEDNRYRGGRDVVQLNSNQAGHHMGETFKLSHAKELGIAEHCSPFNPKK